MMKNKYPSSLKKGDKVAIVSPAGAVDPLYIDNAASCLHEHGFTPVVGLHAKGLYGRFSGSVQERLDDLQQAINDKEVKAILCSRGGYGTVQLIDKLDFSALNENPKWLIGFSDITILHSALLKLKIPSLHAIMVRHLCENDPQNLSVTSLFDILAGVKPQYIIDKHPLNRPGVANGVLAGGNLSVLYGMRGTQYDVNPSGKVLFIEDLAERAYHIDRMMNNFRLGGILEKISGLIIGQFTEIEEDKGMMTDVYGIISEAVSGYDYPVCFNFPAGHVADNLPLVLGARIKLIVNKDNVVLKFK